MGESRGKADTVYSLIEPWVVLAVGNFITACCTRNFTAIQLLRAPIRFSGRIESGIATIDVPNWFPLQDSVLDAADGAIYSKVKDLPLKPGGQKISDQALRIQLDLIRAALPPGATTASLTYFPWFRFLAEPVGYDAIGRVAAYVGRCLRYLLIRSDIAVSLEMQDDICRLTAGSGMVIDVAGMQALRRLSLVAGDRETIFDIEANRIQIDRRMFPAAYEAGAAAIKAGDSLASIDMAATGEHLTLALKKDSSHV